MYMYIHTMTPLSGPLGISFPLNDRSGPIMTSGESEMLTCTNLSSLAGTNYTVEWQNNFTTIQGVTENTLVVDTSGYYCCVLNGTNLQKSYFCITVVIGNSCECSFLFFSQFTLLLLHTHTHTHTHTTYTSLLLPIIHIPFTPSFKLIPSPGTSRSPVPYSCC